MRVAAIDSSAWRSRVLEARVEDRTAFCTRAWTLDLCPNDSIDGEGGHQGGKVLIRDEWRARSWQSSPDCQAESRTDSSQERYCRSSGKNPPRLACGAFANATPRSLARQTGPVGTGARPDLQVSMARSVLPAAPPPAASGAAFVADGAIVIPSKRVALFHTRIDRLLVQAAGITTRELQRQPLLPEHDFVWVLQ